VMVVGDRITFTMGRARRGDVTEAKGAVARVGPGPARSRPAPAIRTVVTVFSFNSTLIEITAARAESVQALASGVRGDGPRGAKRTQSSTSYKLVH